MSDPFWLTDPSVLFEDGNWYRIIPNSSMTKNEVLNSLTLLFAYLAIIISIFTRNLMFILLGLLFIGAIVFYYYNSQPNYKVQTERYRSVPSSMKTDGYYDTMSFAKYAYGDMDSCKQNPKACKYYRDPRNMSRH